LFLATKRTRMSYVTPNGVVAVKLQYTANADADEEQRGERGKSTEQRRLIVYAYSRSGSTLTGQMFNYNPTSFYWFEPLAAVTAEWLEARGKVHARNYFHYDNGTEKCVRVTLMSITICKAHIRIRRHQPSDALSVFALYTGWPKK